MSIFRQVVTLPPIVVTSAYLGAIAASATLHIHTVHLIMLAWPLCLYVTARQLTQPPPQKRYPLFAKIALAAAIAGGLIIGFQPPIYLEPAHNLETSVFFSATAAFSLGALTSFWVTADALLKAETGKPWIANPKTTSDTMQLVMLLPIGIWFLHPRIKRLLEENEAVA